MAAEATTGVQRPSAPPTEQTTEQTAAGSPVARRADPRWLLLPQRVFLGFTFAYAGVDKLSDPAFFDPAAPTSISAQIAAFRDTSPIRPLLGLAQSHAHAVGLLIALAEVAVGVATLLGVRVRLAAVGGALISLSLLLTVTWQTRPYYYGSDLVFLVCWLPLVGYGDGGLLSLQHAAERRWAASARPSGARRALLVQLGGAAVAIATTALGARLARGGAAAAGTGSAQPTSPISPQPPTGSPAPAAAALARVADVPVGGVLPVTVPDGTAAYLVRVDSARFVAFSRTCTHAGCQVAVTADRRAFACPCHLARYDARSGQVLAGPAPRPLDQIPVRVVGADVLAES